MLLSALFRIHVQCTSYIYTKLNNFSVYLRTSNVLMHPQNTSQTRKTLLCKCTEDNDRGMHASTNTTTNWILCLLFATQSSVPVMRDSQNDSVWCDLIWNGIIYHLYVDLICSFAIFRWATVHDLALHVCDFWVALLLNERYCHNLKIHLPNLNHHIESQNEF